MPGRVPFLSIPYIHWKASFSKLFSLILLGRPSFLSFPVCGEVRFWASVPGKLSKKSKCPSYPPQKYTQTLNVWCYLPINYPLNYPNVGRKKTKIWVFGSLVSIVLDSGKPSGWWNGIIPFGQTLDIECLGVWFASFWICCWDCSFRPRISKLLGFWQRRMKSLEVPSCCLDPLRIRRCRWGLGGHFRSKRTAVFGGFYDW